MHFFFFWLGHDLGGLGPNLVGLNGAPGNPYYEDTCEEKQELSSDFPQTNYCLRNYVRNFFKIVFSIGYGSGVET